MNRISDEKIKALAAEYLTNGMIKTKALITVGYTKNYAEHGGLKLFDNDRLKAEIARQQAKTELKNDITIEQLQRELLDVARDAYADKRYSAAAAAYSTLLKSAGGLVADRTPPENLAGKMLDAKRTEDLRAIAEMYYSQKYLAQPPAKQVQSSVKEVAEGPGEGDIEAERGDSVEATLSPPMPPVADSTTGQLSHTTDF
jgi:phage terminase small subunit